ncbi:hypothetical protein ABW21_db0204974 [Orbilia brochopaga]|nr:hypothetical protein ABW21_db0204974 [Drechslerella brochopaga]
MTSNALGSRFSGAKESSPRLSFLDQLTRLFSSKVIRQNDQLARPDSVMDKDLNDEMCDISEEVENLREIKDIKDELRMVQRVLEDQKTVIAQYSAAQSKQKSSILSEQNRLASLKQTLNFRISKTQRLVRDASSVEDSLNHLLDLKQKQGNLNEARDTRRLANEADSRAKDSEIQNQLLFVFTIITVVFSTTSRHQYLSRQAFLQSQAETFPKVMEEVPSAGGGGRSLLQLWSPKSSLF